MRWIAISGSWRTINQQLEQDVRDAVKDIMLCGDGIVSGGALGVDFIATDEALKHDPKGKRIKIILPTSLDIFEDHFFKRADEGVITKEQAVALITQLKEVRDRHPASLVEMGASSCNQETYYARNTKVIEAADTLYAFQVNDSKGTQDAIDKARNLGKPVTHRAYSIVTVV